MTVSFPMQPSLWAWVAVPDTPAGARRLRQNMLVYCNNRDGFVR